MGNTIDLTALDQGVRNAGLVCFAAGTALAVASTHMFRSRWSWGEALGIGLIGIGLFILGWRCMQPYQS